MPAFCLSLPLPGLGIASRALWPVWRDSTRKEVRFQPLPKRQAVKLYHHARRLERQTRARNRQDGAIGRNGLLALHALLFDFMHYASGRLDPSIKAIARAANISESSVKRGLVKLKAAGVVTWLRRCAEGWIDGRFVLRQQTNAYGVLPGSVANFHSGRERPGTMSWFTPPAQRIAALDAIYLSCEFGPCGSCA
jgi:hypothetical protein